MEDKKETPIPLSKLKKDFSDWDCGSEYEIIKQIGSGSYGSVVEAKKMSTGAKVAIKRMNNLFDDTVDCKRILREITLLRKLDHPNLIKIIEIIQPKDWETFDHIYLVTEYC
jgi:mitogen-activated protein kinase 1/3